MKIPVPYIALFTALVLNATANLLLRFGMKAIGDAGDILDQGAVPAVFRVLTNYKLMGGLIFFALNVFFYMYALQKVPISIAYPIMTMGGFTIIATVAGVFLDERLNTAQWIGVALVIVGVLLVAMQIQAPTPLNPE